MLRVASLDDYGMLIVKGRKGRVFMSETWKKWLESQSAEFQAKAAKCTTQDDSLQMISAFVSQAAEIAPAFEMIRPTLLFYSSLYMNIKELKYLLFYMWLNLNSRHIYHKWV